MSENNKGNKIRAIVLTALFLVFMGALAYFAGRPLLKFLGDPEGFREWVRDKGIWGKLFFVCVTAFQVAVAIIPGEPFEIGAGYAFGTLEGTLLFLVGAAIGGALIFIFIRKFGVKLFYVFFSKEKLESLMFLRGSKRKRAIGYLIFAIPGAPKDLLTYFAGLTDVGIFEWILFSSIGRLPSLLTSTILGDAIGVEKYGFAMNMLALTLIISILGIAAYGIIIKKNNKNNKDNKDSNSTK